MEITTNTKVCKKCGRELPVYEFYKAGHNKDGLKTHCKACVLEALKKNRAQKKKTPKVESQSPLSTFTPRELIEELRKRGYKGTLSITRQVVL